MRKHVLIVISILLSISFVRSQVIYNVTQTSYGPGTGTFKSALQSAITDVNNGLHAIININTSGLIQAPNTMGFTENVSINGSANGTLTIRKDPSLASSNVQGFIAPASGTSDFWYFSFSNPYIPSNTAKLNILNLKFEKFTNAIFLNPVEKTTIEGCLFLDNAESIHVESSITTAITTNTFSESPNNQKPLNSGVHVLCATNDVSIAGNKFHMAYPTTVPFPVGSSSFIGVNITSNSLANNIPVSVGISNNSFVRNNRAIFSDLKPVNDQYNLSFVGCNITGNQFTDNISAQFHFVNPHRSINLFGTNTLNGNYSGGGCNFYLEFKPISNSNVNNFGIDFIGANSLSMPADNTFNLNSGSVGRNFYILGQPNTLNTANGSVNLVGLNLNRGVTIGNVNKINVQETKCNQTSPFPVIDQTGSGSSTGNSGIAPATISSAVQTCNQLTINYFLTGNQHTSANAPLVVEFFVCDNNGGFLSFIGRQTVATVNSSQQTAVFTIGTSFNSSLKLGATVTSNGTSATTGIGTSEPSFLPVTVTYSLPAIGNGCVQSAITMSICPTISSTSYLWNFGDGSMGSGASSNHSYINPGNYNVSVTVTPQGSSPVVFTQQITIANCQPPQTCTNCIGSFAPDPGDYIISLWVKESVSPQPLTYNNAKVYLTFTGVPFSSYTFGTNINANKIIEGWQKIEEPFNIPFGTTHLNLGLVNLGGTGAPDVYFDDIRIFPKDGQMKTYVYDPLSMRLSAILDENNYATFYEYDEEGKLIRIKKETEKGIMTIQESREGLKKQ
ncbi:MAG: hypothetical protein K0S32_1165 [Bacteroidetes bacterium]|jgi:hypothetical protein|nr:hypothetical protein [Bacteroidota bacterium]